MIASGHFLPTTNVRYSIYHDFRSLPVRHAFRVSRAQIGNGVVGNVRIVFYGNRSLACKYKHVCTNEIS